MVLRNIYPLASQEQESLAGISSMLTVIEYWALNILRGDASSHLITDGL